MIAFYLRLSIADGDVRNDTEDESNSIENQRALLQDYIKKKPDLQGEVREYIDDGYSGINFDRPAFRQMLEDMKKGRISVLLTKDLSRLGRDYIGVGDYMEQIFPLLGVRYIAVNSYYDSDHYIGNTMGLEMSVSNLINTLYSRDVSKKVLSGVEARWKQGYSTSGCPTFGYVKDENNKGKWLIEPVAADIVRRIFDYALQGFTISAIVCMLNEQKIMTPGQYREKMGFVKRVTRKVKDEEWLWEYIMVYRILRSYEYTGAMVHHKRKRTAFGSKQVSKVPQEERFIIEGMHEAIVTHEEYENAQMVMRSQPRKMVIGRDDDYPIKGKIHCANCGLRMTYTSGARITVKCPHAKNTALYSSCKDTLYEVEKIDGVVRRTLMRELSLLEHTKEKLKEGTSNGLPERKKERAGLEAQIKMIAADRIHLYERYAAGGYPKEEYLEKKEKLKLHELELKRELKLITGITEYEMSLLSEADTLGCQADQLIHERSSLPKEVCDIFIEKVLIYDEKHIEIQFAFSDLIRRMQEYIAGRC